MVYFDTKHSKLSPQLPGVLYALVAVLLTGFCAGQSAMAQTPVYQVTSSDPTWTETTQGVYTVANSAEDYAAETWERPVKDPDWSDSGGTRTSSGQYRAYADLKSGAIGVDDTFLYLKWEVVGSFTHLPGEVAQGALLEGFLWFYMELTGPFKAFAVGVPSAKDLGANFGDVPGKVNTFDEATEGDVPGSTTGFSNSTVNGAGRTNTGTFVSEVAVTLTSLGLTKANFLNAADYAIIGVAVSNPSAEGDLFANDNFPEPKGSGVEYDTLRLTVPINTLPVELIEFSVE